MRFVCKSTLISQLRLKDGIPTTPTPTRLLAQHASPKLLQSTHLLTDRRHPSTTPPTTTNLSLKFPT
ncbi:hypothetical protein HBH79_035740 [Parastagonospora nodorum]|nr:hypothetical protein HBH51_005440 [Parastagonospora nodorum]KAH4030986.1 hypothetical protein HBI13_027380 [Parastagonospora nodorum]KAH4143915.1 hypothetical protein HBH45_036990 [Parastagonospora nodorum]KAH4168514.1 hypothetical protein HBH43_124880 [Parastagonospora nodorum]KAH4381010.1 hypothetical protein HBH94_071060 [Parastagonospora nodorum]